MYLKEKRNLFEINSYTMLYVCCKFTEFFFLTYIFVCNLKVYDSTDHLRSRSPDQPPREVQRRKQRQVEERRVVYVGRITEGITRADLRKRFETFGPIEEISVHFRDRG